MCLSVCQFSHRYLEWKLDLHFEQQFFLYWGMQGEYHSPPANNLLISPTWKNSSPKRLPPPHTHTKFLSPLPTKGYFPPLNNKFSSYNPIKTMQPLLMYRFCLNFIIFRHTGHANIDFNSCSVFTESCCFQLSKRFKWSKFLLFRFLPSSKKNSSPSKMYDSPL